MRMTYSPQADALAIDLLEGKTARMHQLADNINVDFDAQGRLTSIEILGASAWYPKDQLEQLASPAVFLTLAEAAAEAAAEGEPISPTTLRVQARNGKLKTEKRGRDLVVARHELWNYLENRSPRGERAAGSVSGAERYRAAAMALAKGGGLQPDGSCVLKCDETVIGKAPRRPAAKRGKAKKGRARRAKA